MLIVVSPAKSLDYESELPTKKHSEPSMLDETQALVDVMAEKSPAEIARLMSVSQGLAELNHERYQDFEQPFTTDNARPALLAFTGDVYLGMDPAGTFTERDFTHAQKVLRILSGLYGVLRPLDLMQPYRLEMGTSLETDRGKDLYTFWGDRITINSTPTSPSRRARTCSSTWPATSTSISEARPDRCPDHDADLPRFQERRSVQDRVVLREAGSWRMSGWIIRERIKSAKALVEFDGMGYRYDAERSTPDEPVFVREDGDGLTPTPRSAKLGAMNQPSPERGADDQTFHDVIEAYCGALSYALGETATVHVSTHAAAYDVVVERWGGERTIAWAANTVPGTFHEPPADADANGCGWPTSIEIPIDESWQSGFHLITLRAHDGPDGRRVAHTGFVVRAGAQRQRAVLVLATNTWNA